jgi:hypothetical protein
VRRAVRATLVEPLNGGKICAAKDKEESCTKPACPVDCKMTDWSDWSPCTKTCGRGTMSRQRNMLSPASNGGLTCPHDRDAQTCFLGGCPAQCSMSAWGSWTSCSKECGGGVRSHTRTALAGPCQTAVTVFEESCNTQPCAVDCTYSSWTWTGDCTALCGGGKRTRVRTVSKEAAHGGKVCDMLSATVSCNEQACAVDCVFTEWSQYSRCTHSCGTGTHKRVRTITRVAENGGVSCPTVLEEEDNCNTDACPLDCVMTSWSSWSTCPVTCGKGTQTSTRSEKRAKLNGGKVCGATLRTRDCHDASCPVPCDEGVWSAWSQCSKSCGGGSRTKTRTQVQPRFNGLACGASSESEICGTLACPTDCKLSAWGAFGSCSTTCGAGSQMRTRNVMIKNSADGVACGPLTDTGSCNGAACPVDCVLQNWEPYSACSATCGAGTQSRIRQIFTEKANGGADCGLTTGTKSCNLGACPVNCTTNQWSTWSSCTQDCGGGVSTRERTVAQHATLDGYTCPPLTERKSCNTDFCAVDCQMDTWESWSECSLSCAGGVRSRTRHPLHAAKFGGQACPHKDEVESCNSQACPVNCVMPAFSGAYSTCSKACGTGTQKRYRTPTTEMANGGVPCSHYVDERPCSVKPCSVDCVLSAPESSQCSAQCGTGHITTKYTVITPTAYGGKTCGPLVTYTECNTQSCPISCIQTPFGAWSSCSATCGGGQAKRTRTTLQQGAFGGTECPDDEQTTTCGTDACPVNCAMSGWTNYSPCPRSCGTGRQTRTRQIETAATAGGAACGKTEETKNCNETPCPVDCILGAFGDWGACSKSCGGGKRVRFRSVLTAPQYTGKICAEIREEGDCKTQSCPIDCGLSVWTAWSSCSTTCELGYKTSLRTIVSDPQFGGMSCDEKSGGSYSRRVDCNGNSPCPIHCTTGPWGSWDVCPVSCGGGIQYRNRGVVIQAQHGGECGALQQQQSCGTDTCPINCVLNDWGAWGECTKSCNSGQKTRARTISVAPLHGGVTCGLLDETSDCNDFYCPVDCKVSADWGAWGACSVSCGGGITYKYKQIETPVAFGGAACPLTETSQTCADTPCPVDCVQTPWGTWSTCSNDCGGGESTRTRSTTRDMEHGGKICGDTEATKTCNTHKCPVDCELTAWMNEGSCTHSCGRGVQRVTRYVQIPAQHGGLECSGLREKADECNDHPCPIDCQFTWSGWTPCSKDCGGGLSSNTQLRTTLPNFGGITCGANSKTKTCNEQNCAIDCVMGEWGTWSTCDRSCGGGSTKRTRSIDVASAFGGAECDSGEQSQSCNVQACPVNCQIGSWSSFTDCTVTCGAAGGSKMRSRANVAPSDGGMACPHESTNTEIEVCNQTPCPQHCQVGGWSLWTTCSKTCGGGTQARSRSVISRAEHGGYECPNVDESRGCNDSSCPIDCQVSAWSSWGECSVTCGGEANADLAGNTGGGRQTRTRTVVSYATPGGKGCGDLSQDKGFCNTQPCPVDCQLSEWSSFGDCTNTCGEGTKTRSRQRTREALHSGQACATPLVETVQCTDLPECPVDCELTSWTTWTTCTKTCAGGKQTRTRDVITPANDSGVGCGPQSDSQDCSTQACPINCVKADTWNEWSICTVTCGGGHRTKTKTITTPAAHGGDECVDTEVTETCGANNCPIDCEMTQWSTYSACTKSCGTGSMKRQRSTAVEPHFGGEACGHVAETTACNDFACGVDCVMSSWSTWTSCTKTCGSGNTQRTKQISTQPLDGGVACTADFESKACNVQLCPIDCVEEG